MSQKERLIIIGARGLGRQVATFIQEESSFDIIGFLDDITDNIKKDIPILGPVENHEILPNVFYLVALGEPKWRQHYVDILTAKKAKFATYISSRAMVAKDALIGEGTIICPGAIVTTNVSLGRHVLLNIATSVSHDSQIGDFVTLSPGARVTGACILKNKISLGTNAVILPRISLKNNITIGAGAVVVKSCDNEGVTLVGIPAKPILK